MSIQKLGGHFGHLVSCVLPWDMIFGAVINLRKEPLGYSVGVAFCCPLPLVSIRVQNCVYSSRSLSFNTW